MPATQPPHGRLKEQRSSGQTVSFAATGSRSEIIPDRDITYIEAARNYAVIHARGATHVVRRTLESIESSLDPKQFLRVSRSVIVNSGYIKAVEALSHGDRRIELTTGDALTWTRKYHREARIA